MPLTVRTPSKKMSNIFSWRWMMSGLPTTRKRKYKHMYFPLYNYAASY
ncbi:unnamed protein product [Ixodes persulcatus]